MGLDFELLLVVLTFVTGVIWAWDKWSSRRRSESAEPGPETKAEENVPWWLDLSRSLFPVILAVLVIRSFVVEPFRIPSGSMVPTLLTGDFILVNKFTYGLRLPVLHNEILDLGEPERGDVVVFRYPEDPRQDYVKRVIGLPGDHIEYRNKQIYLNGKRISQTDLGRYTGAESEPDSRLVQEAQDEERAYRILKHSQTPSGDFSVVVPPNQYFVLGDNRDRSADSRRWGFVPTENMVGKAFLIWFSWRSDPFRINWERIGDRIQ